MNTELFFSSKTNDWATPVDFFEQLHKEFSFTLDPCASSGNHKCEKYYTLEDDGLRQDWGGHTVFCNPPYGRDIPKWIKKCHDEAQKQGTIVVALVPSRTDTRWFHDHVYGKAEIRFVKGRLKFGNSKNSAPFPSMVAVWRV